MSGWWCFGFFVHQIRYIYTLFFPVELSIGWARGCPSKHLDYLLRLVLVDGGVRSPESPMPESDRSLELR
jgi:hypothetical protein